MRTSCRGYFERPCKTLRSKVHTTKCMHMAGISCSPTARKKMMSLKNSSPCCVSAAFAHNTGYTIPAGWGVMVCPPAVHLNPDIYEDPLAFNPWRWQVRLATVFCILHLSCSFTVSVARGRSVCIRLQANGLFGSIFCLAIV